MPGYCTFATRGLCASWIPVGSTVASQPQGGGASGSGFAPTFALDAPPVADSASLPVVEPLALGSPPMSPVFAPWGSVPAVSDALTFTIHFSTQCGVNSIDVANSTLKALLRRKPGSLVAFTVNDDDQVPPWFEDNGVSYVVYEPTDPLGNFTLSSLHETAEKARAAVQFAGQHVAPIRSKKVVLVCMDEPSRTAVAAHRAGGISREEAIARSTVPSEVAEGGVSGGAGVGTS